MLRSIPEADEIEACDESNLMRLFMTDDAAGWNTVEFQYWDPCDNTFASHEDYDDFKPDYDYMRLIEHSTWVRDSHRLNCQLDRAFAATFTL